MLVKFLIDNGQWRDCGGFEVEDVIEVQLRLIPLLVGKTERKEKQLMQLVPKTNFYFLSGFATEIDRSGSVEEVMIDCGLPVRFERDVKTVVAIEWGEAVYGAGYLIGCVSVDVAKLHKPIRGKVVKIEKVSSPENDFYFINLDLSQAFSKPQRRVTWISTSIS